MLFVQNSKSILACKYTAPSIEMINNTMLFIISMAPSRLGSIVGYSIWRFQIWYQFGVTFGQCMELIHFIECEQIIVYDNQCFCC